MAPHAAQLITTGCTVLVLSGSMILEYAACSRGITGSLIDACLVAFEAECLHREPHSRRELVLDCYGLHGVKVDGSPEHPLVAATVPDCGHNSTPIRDPMTVKAGNNVVASRGLIPGRLHRYFIAVGCGGSRIRVVPGPPNRMVERVCRIELTIDIWHISAWP